jgi:hypothetical protein
VIEYFKRYFGYTFWVGLEIAVFVGLPRLVIFPVAAYLLGKRGAGYPGLSGVDGRAAPVRCKRD